MGLRASASFKFAITIVSALLANVPNVPSTSDLMPSIPEADSDATTSAQITAGVSVSVQRSASTIVLKELLDVVVIATINLHTSQRPAFGSIFLYNISYIRLHLLLQPSDHNLSNLVPKSTAQLQIISAPQKPEHDILIPMFRP